MRTETIRLLGEDFRFIKLIEPRERLSLLSEGVVDKVFRDRSGNLSIDPQAGKTDGTVKIRTVAPDEATNSYPSSESPTSLTHRDMERNAAGLVDTAKRSQINRIRRDTGELIPASIRSYGRGADNKPSAAIVGNAVDRSMSRVEQWPSENGARSVTVLPGGGVSHLTLVEPEVLRASYSNPCVIHTDCKLER